MSNTNKELATELLIKEQIVSNMKLNRSYVGVGLIEQGLAIDINTL